MTACQIVFFFLLPTCLGFPERSVIRTHLPKPIVSLIAIDERETWWGDERRDYYLKIKNWSKYSPVLFDEYTEAPQCGYAHDRFRLAIGVVVDNKITMRLCGFGHPRRMKIVRVDLARDEAPCEIQLILYDYATHKTKASNTIYLCDI